MGGASSIQESVVAMSPEDRMNLGRQGLMIPPFGGDGEDSGDDGDFDDEEPSDVVYMAGRCEVGNKDDEDESKRVEVSYPREFGGDGEPVVILCGEGEKGTKYPDCFSACVVETTNAGFKANVGRQHPTTRAWGQNAQVNWFAVKAVNSGLLQTGVAEVGGKDDEEQTKLITIEFNPPFKLMPTVIATALGEDYPDAFTVTTRKVTKKHAEILVGRTNPNFKSWGQNLKMSWVATTAFGQRGQVTVGAYEPDDGGAKQVEVPIARTARKPKIFVVPQHEPGSGYFDGMCCSVASVEREGGAFNKFTLNCSRVYPENVGWGQNLRANYIIIP